MGAMPSETATLEPVDKQIVRCVELAPRIPFRAMGEVLGVSEQTAARRYRRLVRTGVVRVTTVVDPEALGQSSWTVRVRCRPNGAQALARALAQRPDVSWVTMLAGGAEIACALRARSSIARDDLLIGRLPRSSPVLDIEASMVLHRFVEADEWSLARPALDDDQERAVREHAEAPPGPRARLDLTPQDEAMIDTLTLDGRATFAALGAAAGVDEARAARRLRTLFDTGALRLDVDVSAPAFGFETTTAVWLTTAPADLHRVGSAVASLPSVPYTAAISGRHNLATWLVCRDTAEVYRGITEQIGTIPGIASIEVSPVLRHVKQAGAMTDGSRLVPPGR